MEQRQVHPNKLRLFLQVRKLPIHLLAPLHAVDVIVVQHLRLPVRDPQLAADRERLRARQHSDSRALTMLGCVYHLSATYNHA